MAGRFVFQKLASGMSRTTSRIGAKASASSRATAPVITGATAGGGIGTLSNLFHGAAVRPGMVFPSNHEILRGRGARYLNTRTRRLPRVFKHKKSALDSFGEGKPTSNNLKLAADGPAGLASWASKKAKGLHQGHIFLLKFFGLFNLMAAAIVITAWNDDAAEAANLASMVPSQSLHCSGCNCRSRR